MIQEAKSLVKKRNLRERLGSDDTRLMNEPAALFHPTRILIMKNLYRHVHVDFRDLQNDLGLTAGNLASHLRSLKKEDYLSEYKEIVGNRPRTTYEITEKGRNAYVRFRGSILGVLRDEQR